MFDGVLEKVSKSIPFSILPDYGQSGIYFLHRNQIVVYVGQATNMRVRIADHLAEGRKTFDAVSCFLCSERKLDLHERLFICWFVPAYNRCGLSAQLRMLKDAGCSREEMMRLAVGKSCRLSQETTAAMLGIDEKHLIAISEKDLPFTVHRLTRVRKRTRRYKMADVIDFQVARKLAA